MRADLKICVTDCLTIYLEANKKICFKTKLNININSMLKIYIKSMLKIYIESIRFAKNLSSKFAENLCSKFAENLCSKFAENLCSRFRYKLSLDRRNNFRFEPKLNSTSTKIKLFVCTNLKFILPEYSSLI